MQVPGPEAMAFWEEAVPLLKIAVRSGTAPAPEAPQAPASGVFQTVFPSAPAPEALQPPPGCTMQTAFSETGIG